VGLIKGLLLLPAAPVRGPIWIAERIADEVEHQRQYGRRAAIAQLERIEQAGERGEIDEETTAEQEEEILAQLTGRGRATPRTGGRKNSRSREGRA
jgi:hypothetical protein